MALTHTLTEARWFTEDNPEYAFVEYDHRKLFQRVCLASSHSDILPIAASTTIHDRQTLPPDHEDRIVQSKYSNLRRSPEATSNHHNISTKAKMLGKIYTCDRLHAYNYNLYLPQPSTTAYSPKGWPPLYRLQGRMSRHTGVDTSLRRLSGAPLFGNCSCSHSAPVATTDNALTQTRASRDRGAIYSTARYTSIVIKHS